VKHGECNHCHKYSGREELNLWEDHLFHEEKTNDPRQTNYAFHHMCLDGEPDIDEGKDGKDLEHYREDGKFEANVGLEMNHEPFRKGKVPRVQGGRDHGKGGHLEGGGKGERTNDRGGDAEDGKDCIIG
jgi:hypothetical protein